MRYEWDERKRGETLKNRGVNFEDITDFEWDTARIITDVRIDYGEDRYVATGLIGDCLHVMAFTIRGEAIRVISLRKANARERRNYEEAADR
ncbi:MAG: BrnT family toxin [Thermodesulfovibrionales bacterium]